MQIAVIIVFYNGEHWLKKCLDSVLASDTPVTIYIVDNASTDSTVQKIKSLYQDNVYLHSSKKNLGFGKANNIALKQAYSDGHQYFFLLNQDARVASNTIRLLCEELQNQKRVGILSPLHYNGAGSGLDPGFEEYIRTGNPRLFSDYKAGQYANTFYPVRFINAAAWMLSRKCLETIGLFNPSFFHYGEDNNYAQRLHFHGLSLGVAPQSRIWHHRPLDGKPKLPTKKRRYLHYTLMEWSNPMHPGKFNALNWLASKQIAAHLLKLNIAQAMEGVRRLCWKRELNAEAIYRHKKQTQDAGKAFWDNTDIF